MKLPLSTRPVDETHSSALDGPPRDATAGGGLTSVPASFWCFAGALLCNVFAGHTDLMGLPVPPDRLLFPAAIALALLDPRIPRPRWRGVYGLMALFVVVAALSALFSHDAAPKSALFALLDRVVMPFLLFGCAPLFLSSPLQRLLLLRALALLGAYLGVVAVAQTAGISALVWPSYIDSGGPSTLAPGAETFRAGGPFLSGEANGMALAMCACTSFLLAALDRGGWRILGWSVGTLATVASILSMTRSVWAGVVLGAVLVLLLERHLRRLLPALLAAAVATVVLVLALLPDLVESLTERGGTSRSLFDRANTNAAALRAIGDSPVFGVGWGTFAQDGATWVRQADTYPLTSVDIEVHNVVLSRAAELGLPAALLYVVCLLAGPGAALLHRRARRDAESGARPASDPWHTAVTVVALLWLVPSMTSPNPYTFPAFVAFTLTGYLFARSDLEATDPASVASSQELRRRAPVPQTG